MISPPYLKKGDKIGIVSTARKISQKEVETAVKILDSWGYEVVLGNYLFEEHHQFSGTTAQRAEDMQHMLDDHEIKAILCARGGYGTVQLIDRLNFEKFVKQPKWVIGYSDITVLHAHIHQQYAIETLHATMPINFKDVEANHISLQTLKSGLEGSTLSYTCTPNSLNRLGKVSGELVGGNLSILYSLMASNSQIDTKDKVLFIEDLDEYLYHIDRMMMNLKRSGMLDNLKALVIGGMSDMNDNTIPYGWSASEIISQAVADKNYPVCFNVPAGHIKDNCALIFGRTIDLEVTEKEARITFRD